MRAGFFYEKGVIRVQDAEIPSVGNDEVLIRVRASGICGTDIHVYNGSEGSAEVNPPIILGHEFSGEVCEVGKNVKGIKVGDRVSVDPNISCGLCRYCKEGKTHLCENLGAIGVNAHGGFAEYCVVPEKQAYKIPDAMSFEEGAFVEPVACCLHGIDQAGIKAGDTVVIIGGGTIGLIMLQLAKYTGAARTIVIEMVPEKRKRAESLGADVVIDPMNTHEMEALTEKLDGGANVTIECVGKPATVEQAVRYTAKGGNVLIFGVSDPNAVISIKPFELFKKELTIKASFVNPYTHKRAIEMMASKKVDIQSLIAKTFSIDELPGVFEMHSLLSQGKILIKF